MIFEIKERVDESVMLYMEDDFSYLDRSSKVEAGNVRNFLNYWVSQFPEDEAKELIARIKSGDKRHFDSSVFEIQLFAMMTGLECKVDIHPELDNEKETRPDFLITTPEKEQFYLEAIVSVGQTESEKSAEKRMNTVLDAINKIESKDFFLGIKADGNPDSPPSGKKLRNELNKWLKVLDPDEVIANYQARGRSAIPTKKWSNGAWSIDFEAIPKAKDKRKAGKLIGFQISKAGWGDHTDTIKTAFLKKARRYGKLDKPLVVAANIASMGVDTTDEMQALFGTEIWKVALETGQLVFGGRKGDGVWHGENGLRYGRLSGAWIFRNLNVWNLAEAKSCLYINPNANHGVPSTMHEVTHAKDIGGEMVEEQGKPLNQLCEFE
ncbi:TPA: hypothetical protein NJ593_004466 [Vibrio parahaemolyticus]|nr:hypothetical protein [Vibrio parahaemolyticus]